MSEHNCPHCGNEPWEDCSCAIVARLHAAMTELQAHVTVRMGLPGDHPRVTAEIQRRIDALDPTRGDRQ